MIKRLFNIGFVFAAVLLLTGCDKSPPETKNTSTLLVFTEFENEVEPYLTRLIVTPEFMRFDDGEGSEDFLLLDRKKQTIFSVNPDEETVMSVTEKKYDLNPPFELKLTENLLPLEKGAPTIEGRVAKHYRFLVNDKVCYDVIAVEGLMPDVINAFKEFNAILASDSAQTFNATPADMQDACNMSMDIFAVGRHLEKGFPIQEWNTNGTGRNLIDYDVNYKPDAKLFELPKAYKHFSLEDYRQGIVSFE